MISVENRKILATPVCLTPRLMGFSLEFSNGGGAQKIQWCPYYRWSKNFDMCIFVYIQYVTDGGTEMANQDRDVIMVPRDETVC